MAVATQETQLYYYDDDDSSVVEIGCPTSISGGGATNETIETTCLTASTRTYIAGLATPQELSFDVRFDPTDTSHQDLQTLHDSGKTVPWAIGFSDGTGDPTYSSGWSFSSRSGITFEGFVTQLTFDFSMNDVVSASVSVQVSGSTTVVSN